MLDLLHLIIKNCPLASTQGVTLSCPCNETHKVSVEGFLLLEEVESSINTAEQQVVEVKTFEYFVEDPTLTALSSRVQRQEGMVRVWAWGGLSCGSLDGAKTCRTIMEHCERMIWKFGGRGIVSVRRDLGVEGWTALATGLQRHPRFHEFSASRLDTRAAPREALKMIWDAMLDFGDYDDDDYNDDSKWIVEAPNHWKYSDDNILNPQLSVRNWEHLIRILDMSEAEFLAAVDVEYESDRSGQWEPSESESEGMEEEDD